MSELRAIRIERGPQGFGGTLIIRPTEQKNKVMYITGGGTAPECLQKIVELSGMIPVDGFHGSAPEEELAMVIVDCGGTPRCLFWSVFRSKYTKSKAAEDSSYQ